VVSNSQSDSNRLTVPTGLVGEEYFLQNCKYPIVRHVEKGLPSRHTPFVIPRPFEILEMPFLQRDRFCHRIKSMATVLPYLILCLDDRFRDLDSVLMDFGPCQRPDRLEVNSLSG
jgi:hypothetical protein